MTNEQRPTWLNDADVENLLDVSIVSSDLEDGGRLALNTCDIDWHDVVWHSAPADVAVIFLHLEYLGP